jgi:hypothetical protein
MTREHAFMASGLRFERTRRLHGYDAGVDTVRPARESWLDPAEQARERELAKRSAQLTRDRLDAALAMACAEHDAHAGVYCWGTARSGVRGVCAQRYSLGVAHPRQVRHPGELAPLATATRQAQHDARVRERLRLDQQQRGQRAWPTVGTGGRR